MGCHQVCCQKTKAPQLPKDAGAKERKYAVRQVELLETDVPCDENKWYVETNEAKCAAPPQAGPAQAGPAQPRKPKQSQTEQPNHKVQEPEIEAPVPRVRPTRPGPSPRKPPPKPSDFPWYGWVVIIVAVLYFAYYFGLVVPSNTAKVVPGPTATLRRGVTGVAR